MGIPSVPKEDTSNFALKYWEFPLRPSFSSKKLGILIFKENVAKKWEFPVHFKKTHQIWLKIQAHQSQISGNPSTRIQFQKSSKRKREGMRN